MTKHPTSISSLGVDGDRPILDWILRLVFRVWRVLWKKWPFKVFTVYIILIFAFAYLYQEVHKHKPKSFAFHSDIIKAKNEELKSAVQQELNKTEANLEILRKLPEILKQTKELPTPYNSMGWDGVSFFSDRYEFAFDLSPFRDKSGSTDNVLYIFVPGKREPAKDMLAREVIRLLTQYPSPYPIEAYQEMTSTLISRYEDQVSQKRAYLESLNENTLDYWSYFDFLYFSTITQATVGYGDMLPNCTLVRLIVLIQTLLALFLLIVAINFASADLRKVVKLKEE